MRTGSVPFGVRGIVSGVINTALGGTVNFYDADIASGSTQFESGVSNSGEFTIGAAVLGAVKFTLLNETMKFSAISWVNATVDMFVTVDETKVDMGRFYVVNHNGSANTISIEAYDALKILDEYRVYEAGVTWPTTAKTLVSAILGSHDAKYDGLEDVSDIPIQDPGDGDKLTQRAAVAYVAQMYGKFVTWGRGNLSFGWYDMRNVHDVGMVMSHGLRTDTVTIGGVHVETGDGKTERESGDGYIINIGDNPFIQAGNVDMVLQNVHLACVGISYRPGTVELLNTPSIEAGDVISVDTANETGVVTIVSNLRYRPSSVKLHVSAEAEEYVGDLRLSHSAYIKQKANENLNDQLNDPNSDLSKRLGGKLWPPPSVYPRPKQTPVLSADYGSSPLTIAAVKPDGTAGTASVASIGITPNGPIPIPSELVGVGWNGYGRDLLVKGNIPVPCEVTFSMTVPYPGKLPPDGGASVKVNAVLMFQKYSEITWGTDVETGKRSLVIKMSGDPICQGLAIPMYSSNKKTTGFAMFFDDLGSRIGGGIMQLTITEGESAATVERAYS